MSQFRFAYLGLLLAAIGLNTAPSVVGMGRVAHAAGAEQPVVLRPEVGKPLQAAQELMKARKYKEAQAKVREADGVQGKTPIESFTIERMRAAAAYAVGDRETATKSFEAVLAANRLPAADKLNVMQALATTYYQARDYSKAATWFSRYLSEGGDDPSIRALLTQTYYLAGDYGRAAKELQAEIQAEEKAGRTPGEDRLQLWANSALKQGDKAGYVQSIEKLVAYHPKKEYWADLLNRVQQKPGFADRLALDVLRLKLATGQLSTADDYMEMSQLALQAGFPAEAVKIIEQGFKSGVLGAGAEAARQKRLRDLAVKTAADDLATMGKEERDAGGGKDGTGLVNLGYAYVTTGQVDKGLALMEKGLKAGGIKRSEDAKLHMGIAYLHAGQKAKAIETFKSVQGSDGTADLARYWMLHAGRSAN
jgi:tetratricopeptide (TPR) repeat protein